MMERHQQPGPARLITVVQVVGQRSIKVHGLAPVTDSIDVVLHYDDAAPHVPSEKVEKTRAAAAENGIGLVVCASGGSTTGLAKAVALTLSCRYGRL